MMLPPSIDRSDFGAQRMRDLEEHQVNLQHLCEAALEEEEDFLLPPPPAALHKTASLRPGRQFSPPAADHPHCDLMTGEVQSFSSSGSDEFFRKRLHTPSPHRNMEYGDGTVATPSPYSEGSGSRHASVEPGTSVHGGSTVNEMPYVDRQFRASPSVKRTGGLRPPPPPPDDEDDTEKYRPHAPRATDATFREIYRKYVGREPEKRRYGGSGSALASLNHNTVDDSRSCSILSTIRVTGHYVPGTAYKAYLTATAGTNAPSSPAGRRAPLPPPPPHRDAAARYAPLAAPSTTVTYQPSSRSTSEQSDYSNYSKTAATIDKWRKVLYEGKGNSSRHQDVSARWEAPPPVRAEKRVPPPSSLVDSRSVSSLTEAVPAYGGRRYSEARELMEKEERKIKRYFNVEDRHSARMQEDEEWNVSSAVSFVEKRRQRLLEPPLASPTVSSRGSVSPVHPYNDCGSPDGLVDDHPRGSLHRKPQAARTEELNTEFFDDDPVRTLLQHHTPESVQRRQNIPPPSPSACSQESELRSNAAEGAPMPLVPQRNEVELQLEVQKTRDKAEALARHLVRALDEKRKLQANLSLLEEQLSGSGQLVATPKGTTVVAEGGGGRQEMTAALRRKERELAIYEEEIERLNGLVRQQQEQLARHSTPSVVLAAQTAAAAEVDAAINEVGVAHLSQRKAEERAEKLANELESAQSMIYTLDGRVVELQKAAMVQQMEGIRASAYSSAPERQKSSSGGTETQALIELIRHAEGLLHQSDASSRYTASHLESLQRTYHELRHQLHERGGEVVELQEQCNALRRDKNILRLYGSQWLRQLQDVKADAEVIAEIVHTSKEDAEKIVAGSLNADSLLTTSLSTLEDITPIREHNSSSRQFAELVMHDMHAVARYLAALRRMNIGEQEGYTMLERLASGKPLLLEEDETNDIPTLLAEPAREVVQQKKRFVLDAVEEALRVQQQREVPEGSFAVMEEEADELIVPYTATSVRESSPLPAPDSVSRPHPDRPPTHTPSDTLSRERSTTAKPDAVVPAGRLPTPHCARSRGSLPRSRPKREDDYDEPSLPFFGAGGSTSRPTTETVKEKVLPTPTPELSVVNTTLPPSAETVASASSLITESTAPPEPVVERPKQVLEESTSAAKGDSRSLAVATPLTAVSDLRRPSPSPSSFGSGSGAGLPQLQRSHMSAAAKSEPTNPPLPTPWRSPRRSGSGTVESSLPLEPQHHSEPIQPATPGRDTPRPRDSTSQSPPTIVVSEESAARENPSAALADTPIHAEAARNAVDPAPLSTNTAATAPLAGTAARRAASPTTGITASTEPPKPVEPSLAPAPVTVNSSPPLRRRVEEPVRPSATALPEPALGNPFAEMSQPAELPPAPGMRKPDGIPSPRWGRDGLPPAPPPPDVGDTIPLGRTTPVGSVPSEIPTPPPPVSSDVSMTYPRAGEALKLPPRPFTKPVQQRAALKPQNSLREGPTAAQLDSAEQFTPANVSTTDSVVAEALTLSPIMAQPNRSSSVRSMTSLPNGGSLDNSTSGGAFSAASYDNEAKRKENVAKILERLRASKSD